MVSGGFKKILGGVLLWTTLSFSAVLVDKVVASVNSEPILESDIKMGMLYYATTNRKDVIDKLIEDMLLYQFLIGRGMQVPPELIEQALVNIARVNRMTLDGIAQELAKEGLTLQDLRRFLEREILATQGLIAFLEREVRVSDVELELEKLKSGNIRVVRNIELLVIDRRDEGKLKIIFSPEKGLDAIAKEMGASLEKLRVARGDLVEFLDKEVWKASPGEIVFAEDKDYVYIAKVLSQEEITEGKSIEELREEILLRKMETRRQELLERLRRNSFIKIIQ
ncbi:peptidylprolyl isomerase [Hydrogenobacter sp. T-2]|uniref:peptidylprolyl isomerase n=1 Tax=Pampinifervens diazotrophicum TaxID=1632018 RepID=UPI002B25EFDE|nr:peptidylprolyl isomerase [Hydrogenobacter sp. T-2]WPM31776.1 peptidylprolyl isomerase [Hydrogenobacter sp. T-2]